jgi:peptide/nickel transport system permease protein
MARYTLNRVGSGLLTLFLFVTLLFFLVNMLVPGDFVSQFILTADQAAAMREQVGLDRPLHVQYFDWLRSLVTLNLGTSFQGHEVWESISAALPSTLLVLAIGLTLAFTLGGWLGRASAYRGSSLMSGTLTFAAILFLTAFPPALAFAMEEFLRTRLGFTELGVFGRIDEQMWFASDLSPAAVMWRMLGVLALTFSLIWVLERLVRRVLRRRVPRLVFLVMMMGLSLLVWRWMGLTERVFDLAATMTLLLAGVVLLTFGDVLLVTRAAMDDVLLEDYVMVARAKGMPERQVRDRHAARAALLPVLSRFTVSIPYFMTGLVILEAVFGGVGASSGFVSITQQFFGRPGMGVVIFDAVRTQDTPMIVGSMLVVGVLTLLLRVALDFAHAALDPRIRLHRGGDDD